MIHQWFCPIRFIFILCFFCLVIFFNSTRRITLQWVFFLVLKKLKYFQVNEFLASQENTAKQKMLTEEVAMGFIQVANEAMCRPIRALTQVRQFMCLTAICWKILLHIKGLGLNQILYFFHEGKRI